ncbi:unnamed protein product [Mytilus coruscus]|uniref:Ig-like domain-containing protein n=1 Tax=Mytilus coruscus TaxID=42192 RepID=A0A6J8D9M1_MYTCO|nr:unnamed protein product [Mytilus coruscus]
MDFNRLYGRVLTTVFIFNGIAEVFAFLALKGSTVQLICPYKHTVAGTLDWSFKSRTATSPTIYTVGKTVVSFLPDELKQRLTVTGNHIIGEYHLNISNIRESDQGTYECLTGGKIDQQALNVIVGPTNISIENETSDNKIPGKEGQDMTIKCTAVGGQPQPDIKLVILGFTYTGDQSAQHTFKPQRTNDGSAITCQAGYTEINFYPLITEAYIHLMLKPIITPFVSDTLSTEETKSFEVSCLSTGSRPAASMHWLLGQKRIDVTSNSSSQSNKEPSTQTYSVTSNLKYRVDRSYNGQKLICRASNVVDYMETLLTLNVKCKSN